MSSALSVRGLHAQRGTVAVLRGVEVLAERRRPITDDKARDILFGAEQYRRH